MYNNINTKEKIVKYIRKNKKASGKDLSGLLGISRQALNKHIKVLIQRGTIEKEGITRGAVYKIAGKIRQSERFRKRYILNGLEEDKVFTEIALLLNLRKYIRKNVFDIIKYVFTEILNNAIEHSLSQHCNIEVILDQYKCNFTIRDYGIGIFYSIYSKFCLRY